MATSATQTVFPVLRIKNNKSIAFYERLGFTVDWRHSAELGFPETFQLSRDGQKIILREDTRVPLGVYAPWVFAGFDDGFVESQFSPKDSETLGLFRYEASQRAVANAQALLDAQGNRMQLGTACFVVPNAEAVRRQFVAMGIQVPATTLPSVWGSECVDVTDPDGNRLEFIQQPDDEPLEHWRF